MLDAYPIGSSRPPPDPPALGTRTARERAPTVFGAIIRNHTTYRTNYPGISSISAERYERAANARLAHEAVVAVVRGCSAWP